MPFQRINVCGGGPNSFIRNELSIIFERNTIYVINNFSKCLYLVLDGVVCYILCSELVIERVFIMTKCIRKQMNSFEMEFIFFISK